MLTQFVMCLVGHSIHHTSISTHTECNVHIIQADTTLNKNHVARCHQ